MTTTNNIIDIVGVGNDKNDNGIIDNHMGIKKMKQLNQPLDDMTNEAALSSSSELDAAKSQEPQVADFGIPQSQSALLNRSRPLV